MKWTASVGILACVLLAANSQAKADFTTGLIDMDFDPFPESTTQTGAALIGSASDTWNSGVLHPPGVLKLANGNVSNGVTISLAGQTSAIIGGPTFASTPYSPLMYDGYIVGTGKTMTLTFNGLTASQPYNLYLYSVGVAVSDENRTTTFTIAGNSRSANDAGSPSAFVEGVNYVHFGSQPADASGQIAITIQGSGGSQISDQSTFGGIINGFQIAPVPAPDTMTLVVTGLPLALIALAHLLPKAASSARIAASCHKLQSVGEASEIALMPYP